MCRKATSADWVCGSLLSSGLEGRTPRRAYASDVSTVKMSRKDRSGEADGAVARGLDERGEDQRAVRGAEERVDRVLGMRHEAHDVAALVADAGDVVDRAVARLGVAQHDLA